MTALIVMYLLLINDQWSLWWNLRQLELEFWVSFTISSESQNFDLFYLGKEKRTLQTP